MLNQSLKIKKSDFPYDYFIIDNLFDDSNYKAIRKDFYQAIENINSWHEEYGVAYSDNSKFFFMVYLTKYMIRWIKKYDKNNNVKIIVVIHPKPFEKSPISVFEKPSSL